MCTFVSIIDEFEPEFTVINEPDDYYGRPGDIATFIVEAEGANLSYQWLCRAPGADNFEYLTSSDATTNTLRVEMTAASNGAEYRCFITDANGDMGSTRIATIKLDILDWEMEYNTSGIRTKRISDEKTYSYIYAGDKLMRMTVGNDTLDFSYDTNGVPLTMTYNGTVYYYITNLQGDVISLELADGGSGASYAYDAWGNIIAMSGTLAELNPLRYRGYVYDQETGFYYLNSRYYDPAVGRFINADSYPTTGQGLVGNNMFAYCGNNPIMYVDRNGDIPEWVGNVLAGAGIIAGTALFVGAIVASAGAIAALAGVGAATIGLSTGAIATVTAIATNATYVIAGGVALFGANEAVESVTGGTNLIRDKVMGGNQSAYNLVKGTVNTLGTLAVTMGTIAPQVIQNIAKTSGTPKISNGKTVGYQKNYTDTNGNWSLRIDATTHGNAKLHHNPHYHIGTRGGNGISILSIWETVKGWFGF